MDGTEYAKKACYLKALSLDLEYAPAWSNLGVVGGGPERAGGGWRGQGASGGLLAEGPRGLFFQGGVRGEVKRLLFCEGVVKSVEGACRFLLAWYLTIC